LAAARVFLVGGRHLACADLLERRLHTQGSIARGEGLC
jgi:hypothetical protein